MRRVPPTVALLLRRSLASAALLPAAPRCLMRALLLEERPATQASFAMTVRYIGRYGVTDGKGDEAVESFNRECSTSAGSSSVSDDSACPAYVEKLCRSGNLVDAVRVLRDLGDEQVGLHTFNMLLQHTAEANSFALFAKVFRFLLLSKLAPDLSSYVSVARALQKVDDCELILKFIGEIVEITKDRDPTVMNQIIFATAEYGDVGKCLIVFEEFKKGSRSLDVFTFNTILDVLGKAGRVDQMLCELKVMEEYGHSPDIVTYNTLINCLRRLGRLDLCKRFATEMLEKGITPDLRTHTALIDSLGRAGHITEALEMFEQMKKSHQPSIYVYRALISNAKKAGRCELALKLSEEMNSSASDLLGPEHFKKKFKGRRIRNDK